MTGEQFYRAHVGTAADLGIADGLPPWDQLSHLEQARWEQQAYLQDLRDRPVSDRIRYGKDW